MVTQDLISKVTKTVNDVNFVAFEGRTKEIILSILEEPLGKIGLQETMLEKYGEGLRKTVRRVYEMEYTINK